ncbi:hypothetical protein RO3G_12101 [Lichtheimia corymbifera JMRC:FSU:9682]|uniref:Protein SQS1 n=1 Tax=Lichtheimia corymbifera JMRC:FSU:9682 TaxID=1263082 RepID=A0A068REA1_9FUNG|nr:hypothetical protein RO3G_12101 [Lichtheimia corymbifera JMRC:FSU:9682]
MPKRSGGNRRGSHRGRGRGRGGHNRGGGRGRGGGGHGRNRHLIPSGYGFVYEPGKHNTFSDDDYEDDFPVFAQFGAVDDPNDDGFSKRRKRKGATTTQRAPLLGEDGLEFQPSRGNRGYGRTVAFTRATTLVQQEDDNNGMMDNDADHVTTTATTTTTNDSSNVPSTSNNSNIIVSSSGDEENNVEATGSSLGFYFDSTPSKVILNDDDEDDDGDLYDYNDSIPFNNISTTSNSKVFIRETRNGVTVDTPVDEPNRNHNNGNNNKRNNRKQKRQKKKIIPGDDIYIGSDSDSSDNGEYEHLFTSKQDDDIAAMRDYIENIQLDEDDEAAMRAFANGDVNSNYDNLPYDDESDDQDSIRNGGFHYISSDESIEEIDEDAFNRSAPHHHMMVTDDDDSLAEIDEETFRASLLNAMDDVPPSLHAGMRNRIHYNEKRAKKISKKEKRLEKQNQKGKKKDQQQTISIDMRKIDQRIQQFIRDESLSSYQFAPMSKMCRRQIHLLASAYNIKTESYGTGAQRMPLLQKTTNTQLLDDRRSIERFLQEAQATIDARSSILRKNRQMDPEPVGKGKKKGKKGKQRNKKEKQQDTDRPSSKPAHNSVVGAGADPINESNIGHRMLAAMGWKHGDSLGTNNEGIAAPIEVVIRKKRVGLGS